MPRYKQILPARDVLHHVAEDPRIIHHDEGLPVSVFSTANRQSLTSLA